MADEALNDPDDDGSDEFRQMRQAANKAKQAEAEAEKLRKENAIYRAGLTTLNEDQISVLAEKHQGELTKEALTETAKKYGWHSEPEAPSVPAEEQAAHERMDAARTGAAPSGEQPDGKTVLENAMREGGVDGLMAAAKSLGLPTVWDS